jgi:hypothetical protein
MERSVVATAYVVGEGFVVGGDVVGITEVVTPKLVATLEGEAPVLVLAGVVLAGVVPTAGDFSVRAFVAAGEEWY